MLAPFEERQLMNVPGCTCLYHKIDGSSLSILHITYAVHTYFIMNGLKLPCREVQDIITHYLDVIRQPNEILQPDPIFMDFLITSQITDDKERKNIVRHIWRGLLKKQRLTQYVEGGIYCQVHGLPDRSLLQARIKEYESDNESE